MGEEKGNKRKSSKTDLSKSQNGGQADFTAFITLHKEIFFGNHLLQLPITKPAKTNICTPARITLENLLLNSRLLQR